MIDLAGIYAPIPTPFYEDESVAYDHLEANLKRWGASELDGVIMPGSNSEAAYLDTDEKIHIWEVCGSVLKGSGKRLIAGVGVESTRECIRLALEAAQAGAEALLIVPPNYYRPFMTHTVLLAHYSAVADASPVPVMIYNVPNFTGIDFSLETLAALAKHPNIIGIKDTSSNVVKMGSLLQLCPDFQVFAGTGSALLPFLSIGGRGGIMALANFAVKPLRQLLTYFQTGRMEEARKLQVSLNAINSAVTARFGVPGLKYAMDQSGYYGGPCRRPLLPMGTEPRAEIDHLLGEIQSLM
jgi:4-hydroxy-2-oxoglutarate aldolase